MKYHFVQDLLNDGLATRAWSAFASLIRDSELYGCRHSLSRLHRQKIWLTSVVKEHAILKTATDETVDPEPSRQLWWLFIELDVQLSFLLGRQPYIDASHGVPKPILEKMLDEGKGCQQDVLDFTDFMIETSNRAHKHRNNWRSFPEDSEATSTWLQSILDQLQRHYSKILHLPPVNLDKTTLSVLAQHQIDVQLALMVFSGQMLRSIIPEKEWSGRFRDRRKSASKGYYDRLLKNLRTIIDIFDYSHRLDPDIAASSWPRCFGFFSAALMLGITQLQQDGDIKLDKERLQTALRIFSSLAADGQALGIAQYATESLAEILQALKKLRQQTSGSTAVYDAPFIPNEATECSNDPHQATSGRNARSIPKARPDSVTKCRDASHFQEDTHARKIFRPEEMITPCESFGEALNSIWKGSHHHYPQPMLAGPVLDVIPRASSQPESFEQRLFTQTASTSFNSQMNFPEAGYSPNRVANFADYSGVNHETHLPMTFAPLPHDTIFQSLFQTDGNFMWALDPQLLYHHVPMTSSTSQAYTIGDALQSNQCPGFDHMQPMFPSQAQDMIMANTHNVLPIDSTSVIRRALRIPTQVSEFSVPIAQKSPGEAAVQIDVSFPRSPESDRRRSLAIFRQQLLSSWIVDTAAEVHQ